MPEQPGSGERDVLVKVLGPRQTSTGAVVQQEEHLTLIRRSEVRVFSVPIIKSQSGTDVLTVDTVTAQRGVSVLRAGWLSSVRR